MEFFTRKNIRDMAVPVGGVVIGCISMAASYAVENHQAAHGSVGFTIAMVINVIDRAVNLYQEHNQQHAAAEPNERTTFVSEGPTL